MKTLFKRKLFVISLIACLYGNPCSASVNLLHDASEDARLKTRLNTLAIPFIENRGQTHPDVRFYAQTFGGALFVTVDGRMVYSLPVTHQSGTDRLVFRERLLGGFPTMPVGEQEATARVNVFKGENPDHWRTGIPTYDLVSLGDVYDGIEVKLKARGKNVEKLFHVRPAADPGVIRVDVEGARLLSVNQAGELVLKTPSGDVAFTRPEAYQVVDGRKRDVDVRYEISGNTYGFKVGAYDPQKELIIDPLLSTYLGGAKTDKAMAIATSVIMGKRYLYVAGSTTSNDFPGIAMYQASQGYNQDAFIAMIDMDFTAVQFTYLGGDREDAIWDMAISKPDGKVYVVGSTEGHFPVSWSNTRKSGTDVFISRLSADLGVLEKSRYFGGNWNDIGTGIALYDDETADPDDRAVYITGQTNSNDLQVSFNPDHPEWLTQSSAQLKLNTTGATDTRGSTHDAFAAKFTLDLGLRKVTYIGGPSDDSGYGIAVHPMPPHDVYVVGNTSYCIIGDYPWVNKGCLPWTAGGGIPEFVGSKDAFVVRFNANLTADPAPQATYYGGTGLDFGTAIAIHPGTGNVYIVGGRTNEPIPPLTIPTDQYAFVAYFNQALTEYKGDAHIGETARKQTDRAQDIKIVSGVGIYVSGWTGSNDLVGTGGGILPTFRGGYSDLFVARYHNNLELNQATYVGGSSQDDIFSHGLAVAEDPAMPGNWHVFVAGNTYGSGLAGVTDTTAFQSAFKGGSDIFVTRMNADLKPDATPDIEVQPRSVDFGNVVPNVNSATKTVWVENIGGTPLTLSSIAITGAAAGDFIINTTAGTAPCGAGFPLDIAGSSSCSLSIVFKTAFLNQWREADLIIQTANEPDEPSVRVPLIGYSGPEIEVTSINFPTTQIGSSTQKTFQIKNVGVSTLTISGIQKTGIYPSSGDDFTLLYGEPTTTCPDSASGPFPLLSGRSCNVTVQFTPSPPPGPQEAMAFIFSDDLDENPAFVDLFGEGVTELRTDIWSHNLEFRDTPVGNSRALPWIITNTGSVALSIDKVTLSDTTNFSIDPNGGALPCGPPPFSLAKVTSCTMTVTFKPRTLGSFNQTISIDSNDPDETPLVIRMTGNSVTDTDGDGIPDGEESGDGNHDGVPDAQQPHVAALQLPGGAQTVVIESKTAGTTITNAQVLPVAPSDSDLPASLAGADFPFGLYQFTIHLPPGVDTAVVTITLPPGETMDTYIKYGPEAGNVEPHYYDFGNQVRYPGAVTIVGNVITLRLTDNGAGDHDGLYNSIIVDPGAPMRWKKGDLNSNGVVDIADAVLCMRVLTGLAVKPPIQRKSDIDQDGKIEMPDLIYILQKISRLR